MGLFRRSPEDKSLLLLGHLCRLVEEQNSLLRELVRVQTGRPAATRQHLPLGSVQRIRTDRDVSLVTRDQAVQETLRKKEAEIAPWRLQDNLAKASTPANGLDSAPGNSTTVPPPTNPPSRELF